MRQPFLGFKFLRSIRSIFVLFACLLSASGCSTMGLSKDKAAQAETGSLVESLKLEKVGLETKIASLQSENARMARRLVALERESKQLVAQRQRVPESPTDAADARRGDLSAASPPAAPSPDKSAPAPKAVVDVANAGIALPDAPVTVDEAPRLVQPSFASSQTPVFENEASGSEIKLSSVLWGVHLASYRKTEEAHVGWRKLQRENPDQLGLLEPRVERIQVQDKGEFLRLIGGGFSSEKKAQALCSSLQGKGMFCAVASFAGERLSLLGSG